MTDYQLPVLRHLTADEVRPGMTIAGRMIDTVKIGVASEIDCGHWCTASGEVLGEESNGYDLLAEASPITLPSEMGTVIDVTGKPESQVEKIERGMLSRIDLESWAVYDSAEEEA